MILYKRDKFVNIDENSVLVNISELTDSVLPIKFSEACPGPEVIKLFSISAQLSMKFQLLINVEIIKISGKLRFKTQKLVIYPANKC